MSFISTPVRALIFALSGAGLAWLWYNVNRLAPVVAILFVWIMGVLLEKYGVSRLPDHPAQALRWLEYRFFSIAALTAATAAVAIVIGVEVTAPGKAAGDAADLAEQKEAIKAIVTSVAAALAAFVAAIAIKAEDVDENIGSNAKKHFYDRYGSPPPSARIESRPRRDGKKLLLPPNSQGQLAVYNDETYDGWTRKTRAKRVEDLQKYLDANPLAKQ